MIILGIDPGSRKTGYAFIDNKADKIVHIHSGFIAVKGEMFPERLGCIFKSLNELIEEYQPFEMSIENVFMHKNADSALKLGQARGAAICAAMNHNLDVAEYTAKQVKKALVGNGAATKQQVQYLCKQYLNIKKELQEDEADAIAVAFCHAQSLASEKRTGLPSAYFKRKTGRARR
ncbi:MAG: crossover junction endodeoxyribonuclease RuvC [Gammaproteobacteria bacterium]|nr:crossover junction endodeoxyribonuclease RuvC [Gammaproteobacteria bacterium]